MSIQYYLRENYLTDDPKDCIANVVAKRTVDLNEVINRMIQQGSTVTRADILSVFDDFMKTLQNLLAEGAAVNLPFTNYATSIKGVFVDDGDTFDSNRHSIYPSLYAGVELKAFFKSKIGVEKIKGVKPKPVVEKFTDLITGETNSIITPGGMGQIKGDKLKFNQGAADEGIYFIASDNSEKKVTTVGLNKPGALMFMIPADLTSGEYSLEVRARISSEDLRSGWLDSSLTVA